MAVRPGEENVATLFGDIHYFYSPPEVKPRHHRFDSGSYVYLFENANERRCRVEIANNAGTEEQDAFDGFLDQTNVRYSYKQSSKVSIEVSQSVDQNEWHLPTYDPRNENKYHYKLHSLDIYFWTPKDALSFVNGVRRVLPAGHIEVLDEPAPPPPLTQHPGMSKVVQRLESVAIADSQPQQSSATSSLQGTPQNIAPPPSEPPPSKSPPQNTNFAPAAYNPAAPAAPEEIRHREKTPPPDENPLNPLAMAVAYDYQKQPFTPGLPTQYAGYPGGLASPGLPQSIASPGMTHFAPPPQAPAPLHAHPGMQRAATMPLFNGMPSPGLASPYGAGFPAHLQGIPQAASSVPPPPPPPSQTPGSTQAPSQPPPGGYSTYSYNQTAPSQGDAAWSVHQQAYRPTETEATGHHGKDPRGKIEENVGRFEKGMSGMLKKFEKKFG